MEKIAKRKAAQVGRIEALRRQKLEAQAAGQDAGILDAQIARENTLAQKDISNLTQAVADRHEKKRGGKTKARVLKLLQLAAAHDAEAQATQELERKRAAIAAEATAIEQQHDQETARMNARHKLQQDAAKSKLESRLAGRRRKKMETLR